MRIAVGKIPLGVVLLLAGNLVARAQEPSQISISQDPVVRRLVNEIAIAADNTNESLVVISEFFRAESDRYFDLATTVGGHSGFERYSVELTEYANGLDPTVGDNKVLFGEAMFILNRDSGTVALGLELLAFYFDTAQAMSGMTDLEWRWLQRAPTGHQVRRIAGRQGQQDLRSISRALDEVADAAHNVLSVDSKIAEAHWSLGHAEGNLQIESSWSDDYICNIRRIDSRRDLDDDGWRNFSGKYTFKEDRDGSFLRDSSGHPIKIPPNSDILSMLSFHYYNCFEVTSVDPFELETFGENGWKDVNPALLQAAVASVTRYVEFPKQRVREAQQLVAEARRAVDLWQRFSQSLSDDAVAKAEAAQTAVQVVWETWEDAQDAAHGLKQRLAALESRRE